MKVFRAIFRSMLLKSMYSLTHHSLTFHISTDSLPVGSFYMKVLVWKTEYEDEILKSSFQIYTSQKYVLTHSSLTHF